MNGRNHLPGFLKKERGAGERILPEKRSRL